MVLPITTLTGLTGAIDWAVDDVRYMLIQSGYTEGGGAGNIDDKDIDDVEELLTRCTECTFTNYARAAVPSRAETIDTANDMVEWTAGTITVTSAGGATNNTVGAIAFYVEGASDAVRKVISIHDFAVNPTTDGSNLVITQPVNGWVIGT